MRVCVCPSIGTEPANPGIIYSRPYTGHNTQWLIMTARRRMDLLSCTTTILSEVPEINYFSVYMNK